MRDFFDNDFKAFLLTSQLKKSDKEYSESKNNKIANSKVSIETQLSEQQLSPDELFKKSDFSWTRIGNAWECKPSYDQEIWIIPFKDGFYVKVYKKRRLFISIGKLLPLHDAIETAEACAKNHTPKNTLGYKKPAWKKRSGYKRATGTYRKNRFQKRGRIRN